MAIDVMLRVQHNQRVANGNEPEYVFYPDGPIAVETIREAKIKGVVKATISTPRNVEYHRKFFALLNTIFDYMTEETRKELNVWSVEGLLIRVKIDLGLYTLWIAGANAHVPEGTPIYIPDSISFAKMDGIAFDKMYKITIGVAIDKYVQNQTNESLEQAAFNALTRFD
jgi:hypothetical protein